MTDISTQSEASTEPKAHRTYASGWVFAFPVEGHFAARFLLWQGQYNGMHVYALRFKAIQEGSNFVLRFDALTRDNADKLLDHLNQPAA